MKHSNLHSDLLAIKSMIWLLYPKLLQCSQLYRRYEALMAVNVKVPDFCGNFPKELIPTARYFQENGLTLAI
jgi:hypothetical protein